MMLNAKRLVRSCKSLSSFCIVPRYPFLVPISYFLLLNSYFLLSVVFFQTTSSLFLLSINASTLPLTS